MAKGHNESNGRVSLRFIHKNRSMGIPVNPGATKWFGVGNKANIAKVEIIPVFPTATNYRGTGGGLGIGKIETSFVIIQIVEGLVIPFMITPYWHIGCATQRPDLNIIKVLIHMCLTERISIGQIAYEQRDTRLIRSDHCLNWPNA